MGLFDIFSNKNAQDAADAQKAGLQAGYNSATSAYGTGLGTATNYYNTALSGYAPLAATANQGTTAYANALGLNGAAGNQSAMSQFQQGPGYQYQLGQGLNAIDRGAAARGTLNSGGTLAAEQAYGQNLANQGWQQNLSNLSGYNTMAPSIAGAQAGINTNLGNLNYTNAGNLANLGWNMNTGQGNAQANADLAKNTASANIWGAIQGVGKLASSAAGFFADGGRPPVGQPSIVGERGPEVFVPDQSGAVIPNDMAKTMGMFGSAKARTAAKAKSKGKTFGQAFGKAA